MSQRTMEAHYRPNWELTQAHGLLGYNCGYARPDVVETFDEHQKSLVWQLLGDAPISAESTVLDVGSGIGGPAGWMFQKFNPARLFGIEYLGSSVRAANDRFASSARRPFFVQGDAHHLPLPDASIDVIFNLESALHYADKDRFISECRRVLKPAGTLCLGDITTSRKWLFAPVEMLNKLPSQFNSNVHLWSVTDYKNAFRRHGFELLRHEDASLPVARSIEDGLAEIRHRGWRASRGFRGRIGFMAVLAKLLRWRCLGYDLFRARPTNVRAGA
ncbi:MAG: methyltransferase domain-containing protein [Phycisphaerae bacterium]|nr:methyltransferase domain-containing protein [Phycisphaerae bacterium]